MDDKQRIDNFWFMLKNSWDIEDREYFEREAPKTGDWSPEGMAVHFMWKRDPKVAALAQPRHTEAQLDRLASAIENGGTYLAQPEKEEKK